MTMHIASSTSFAAQARADSVATLIPFRPTRAPRVGVIRRCVFLAACAVAYLCTTGATATSAQAQQPQYTMYTYTNPNLISGGTLYGIASDNAGNVYFVQGMSAYEFNPILALQENTTPTFAPVAGVTNAYAACTTTGSATSTPLDNPTGVAVDNLGNFYVGEDCGVAEVTNGTSEAIYRGAPTDSYSTVPVAVGAGNVYFGSTQYYTVWKVPVGSPSTSSGVPVAGNGTPGCSNGYIKQPYGLAVDLNGNLYIADQSCNVIWQVTPSGAVSSNAGTVGSNGAAQKGFSEPEGVAVDLYGNVYVADWGNCLVREIVAPWQPSAQTVTIAGNGSCGPSASTSVGPALDVPVQPYGITVGPGGVIFFTDQQDNSENYVRMLMPQGSQLTSPAPGSTLTSNNVTFQWTGTPGATGYSLTLGSQPRASDLYSNSSIAGSATSITVDGLVVNGQTIYADLQTQVDTWLPDPGPVVYHAATELTLTLTPSSVAPAGAFTATVGVGYAVEGPAFTLSVTITYPQTCRSVILDGRKFPMCTPGITAPLFSESSFAKEPDCLGGLFHVCLDLPISYSESLMAPSEAGTYSITATLTPVGSSTPVATVTEPFIVK